MHQLKGGFIAVSGTSSRGGPWACEWCRALDTCCCSPSGWRPPPPSPLPPPGQLLPAPQSLWAQEPLSARFPLSEHTSAHRVTPSAPRYPDYWVDLGFGGWG